MTYATMWTRCWTVAAALGFVLSLFLWGPAAVLGLWAVATLFVGPLLVAHSASANEVAPAAVPHWRGLVGRAMLIALGAVAVIAAATVVPVAAMVLVVLAAATSPWARVSFRTWSVRNAAHTPYVDVNGHRPQAQEPPAPSSKALVYCQTSVRELTDEELCHEWRRSYLALKGAHADSEFVRVVAVRRLFLDEIERRSPTALSAWLSSGARAAGGPDRFLHGDRRHRRSDAA